MRGEKLSCLSVCRLMYLLIKLYIYIINPSIRDMDLDKFE